MLRAHILQMPSRAGADNTESCGGTKVSSLDNRGPTLMPSDTDQRSQCLCRARFDTPGIGTKLADAVYQCLGPLSTGNEDGLVVLCIGTDRSTGDALGPLVGSKLWPIVGRGSTTRIFGTLDDPVHAGNLTHVMSAITGDRTFAGQILAVDACLGRAGNVGSISVCAGPLRPGAGVSKELPPVGNAHIAGVVNVGGFMEYLVLQNTRLSTVMKMADAIARGICLYVSGS